MKSLFAVALAAALSLASCQRVSPGRAVPACPDCNIVLISLDTLRADHVGAYGYRRPTTPRIDRFAAGGVLFENAISQASWTRPAHMSMMTGLFPTEHGLIGLTDRERLRSDVPTLASELSSRGYVTAAFTGGLNVSAVFGFDQGFDLYRSNGLALRDNMEELRWWLDRNGNRKFFLFLHGYEPHGPYVGDPMDRAALGLDRRPPLGRFRRICKHHANPRRLAPYVREYDAAIRRGDRYVGKALDELAARGLADRTIFLFTSDHGEEFGDHASCFHLKTLYHEVLHVPLIVRAPGLAPARVAGLVPASVSVAATLLELAGVDDHRLPGPSLARALVGEDPDFDMVVSETVRPKTAERPRAHLRAATRAGDKLVAAYPDGPSEYYDLATDPAESVVVADAAAVEPLRSRLEAWVGEHSARPSRAEAAELPEDLVRDLEALGYTQ